MQFLYVISNISLTVRVYSSILNLFNCFLSWSISNSCLFVKRFVNFRWLCIWQVAVLSHNFTFYRAFGSLVRGLWFIAVSLQLLAPYFNWLSALVVGFACLLVTYYQYVFKWFIFLLQPFSLIDNYERVSHATLLAFLCERLRLPFLVRRLKLLLELPRWTQLPL